MHLFLQTRSLSALVPTDQKSQCTDSYRPEFSVHWLLQTRSLSTLVHTDQKSQYTGSYRPEVSVHWFLQTRILTALVPTDQKSQCTGSYRPEDSVHWFLQTRRLSAHFLFKLNYTAQSRQFSRPTAVAQLCTPQAPSYQPLSLCTFPESSFLPAPSGSNQD